uniref:Bromo domain-containing protein n=1 Tax=Ditylenchus dipsaci TaxID=166011 RepID=A0A915CYL1_9BILA
MCAPKEPITQENKYEEENLFQSTSRATPQKAETKQLKAEKQKNLMTTKIHDKPELESPTDTFEPCLTTKVHWLSREIELERCFQRNYETCEDSTDTTASTNQKDKSSLKRRLRTTATINTPSTSTPVAKEVFEASIDAGPSRKRGRTAETSDVSANDLVDAPPSKNLRRTHGSPPIAITGIQLKQAAAEMAALIQSPSSETAAEKDNNKRRASTRIQVLQRVPSGSESAVTSAAAATPPAKHPVIDVDEEVIKVLQEEKSISSATIAFKQEAEKEDEKSLWHREKNGKGSFSIGTQTNVSVRHLCVPIQPITLKCKQTRGRIAPKLPLSMGTQTEKVEFGAEDVLYIRPIGSTQTYKHVDKAVSLEEQKASFAKKSKAKPATVTTDEDTIAQIAMENEKLAFLDSHTTSTAENLQKASAHKMTGKESSRSRNTKDSSVISQTSIQHSQSSAVSEIKVVISQRPQSPSKKDKKSMGDAKTLRGSSARPVRAQAPVAAAAVTKTILIALWKEIIAMRNAPIFTQPVSDEDVPGYNSVVKRPMDLSTIRRKIDSGSICTINEFREHILLMFTNAIMFNSTEHDINQIAKDMLRFCLKLIRDAQYAAGEFGDVSPPVKTSRRSQAVTGKLESRPRASPSVDRERAGSVASEASFIAPPPVNTPAAVKLTGSSSSSSAARFKSRLGTRPTLFLNEEEEREANEKEAKKHLLPRKPSISAVQKVRQNTSK